MFGVPQAASSQCIVTIEDIDVLMIIATGFGWDYWEVKEQFEAWGVNVTTIANSLSYEVASCPNRDPRPATADILLSDFNFSDLSQYDVLYVPAGGHWSGLVSSNRVLNLTSMAHEMGLIVGATCIGNRVLCRSSIVNHTKVAFYAQTNTEMGNQGATVMYTALVVTDNGIVTGGGGGGPYRGGYTTAPTFEVCSAIVKAAKGISCLNYFTVTPKVWNASATYELQVSSSDPSDCLNMLNETDIESMIAYVYPEDEYEMPKRSVTLTDDDADGNYTGSFSDLEQGSYHIDIQITLSDDTVEVISMGSSIIDESEPPNDLMIIAAIGIGAVIVVLGVAIFLRKQV